MLLIRDGLVFDDVLLQPKYSEVKSRADVDLSVELPKGFKFANPLIPANMQTICGEEMAAETYRLGGLALLHRFMALPLQIEAFTNLRTRLGKDPATHVGFSVGVQENDKHAVDCWADVGAKIACIDIAHGDSKLAIEMCQWIAKKYPEMLLIAGNVATGLGARRLWEAGADVVKCGVGSGSLCSTRIETGNGAPQLTVLIDVAEERDKMRGSGTSKWQKQLTIISDGGVKNAGDCVKALCFADMVMCGNLFAGTNETPGKNVMMDGITYKEYNGSSTHKTNHIEGVRAAVPLKGPVKDVFTKLLEGISSGCSYQGVANLTGLTCLPQFIRITNAGLIESHPHDVAVLK